MGKEDQAEEIEILQSIYPDELEIHDETNLSIHLALELEPPAHLLVDIEYPPTYPEEAIPGIAVSVESVGVAPESDDGEPKFTYTFTKADCQELMAGAKQVAEENLGLPSVFTVISMIKEQAEELYDSRIKDQEAERFKKLALEEEQEQAKFRGTPVTKETFAEWRAKFRAEMGWDKPKERPFGRFTGREIFVKGIYVEDEDEDGQDEEDEEKSNEKDHNTQQTPVQA